MRHAFFAVRTIVTAAAATALVTTGARADCPLGQGWWWPPAATWTPSQPEEGQAVTITVSGVWPDTCAPNDSGVQWSAAGIGIHVILRFDVCDRICGDTLTPWQRSETVEGLEVGTYELCAALFDPACQAEPCTPCTPIGTLTVHCPGDVNGDHQTNLSDLTILLAHFGLVGGATREQGDLDGDGSVTLADLARLLASFGRVCS